MCLTLSALRALTRTLTLFHSVIAISAEERLFTVPGHSDCRLSTTLTLLEPGPDKEYNFSSRSPKDPLGGGRDSKEECYYRIYACSNYIKGHVTAATFPTGVLDTRTCEIVLLTLHFMLLFTVWNSVQK